MELDPLKPVFFCGIGGSGMLPLALILLARGFSVIGSDRAYDQGQTPEKFEALQNKGVGLFSQDGTGMNSDIGVLVVSSAVEDSIPDVAQAKSRGIPIRKRADILAELFHKSTCSIGVAGTSGKTTVTGMIATMMENLDLSPTVMNGGRVKNLEEGGGTVFGNALVGRDRYFVSEMDESDGSIDLFTPDIAVLNNIAVDHASLEELDAYFQSFISRSRGKCIVNLDNDRVKSLELPSNAIKYGVECDDVALKASNLVPKLDGISFDVNGCSVHLKVPGQHNVSNALAALSVARALDIDLEKAIKALETFTGIKRRLETIGTQDGVTVIDDFGHNPDKIAASLATLKEFDGRLIVMFQPHGFAPLRLMGQEMAEVFGRYLSGDDILCIPEVYYAGGTVDRSVTGKDFVDMIEAQGVNVHYFSTRDDITPFIQSEKQSGDRIVIMGARDDTLTEFGMCFL